MESTCILLCLAWRLASLVEFSRLLILDITLCVMSSKQRKREAVTNLRDLAESVGLTPSRKRPDMGRIEFEALCEEVLEKACTPDQRQTAEQAKRHYNASDVLPPLSSLPPLPGAAPADESSQQEGEGEEPVEGDGREGPFRLRSTSCLFTWNSIAFGQVDRDVIWGRFLRFLASLDFVWRWTATMESSLRSNEEGRVHFHAFLEFVKAVDWKGLDLVRFEGSLPNASPTRARGDNQRVVKDEGHFYVWAAKRGTLKVETSGYVPWKDYAIKGAWLDGLWTEHKLDHDTYLAYAAQVRVGFVNRQRQAEAVQERERKAYLRRRRAEVAVRGGGFLSLPTSELIKHASRHHAQ